MTLRSYSEKQGRNIESKWKNSRPMENVKNRLVLLLTLTLLAFAVLSACSSKAPRSQTRAAQYSVEGRLGGGGKQWHDNRQFADAVATTPLRRDGIHDPANPAIEALQEPDSAMSRFPFDRRGGVDWVKTLEQGLINPRQSVKGDEEMLIMNMDIVFTDTGEMPWVRFPHLAHTQWLDCSNCHPDIFVPQRGFNNPSMDGILAGEHCGRCHDKVAFPLWICERCHSVPHDNSPNKWW